MDRHRNSMKGLPLPNSCGGGSEHDLMPVLSAFRELGEGGLLVDNLLPDDEGPRPKDKMGEERRDRF